MIGHAGVGGTVGLCVPDKRVAVAVTVSRLSGERKATKRLLECLLAEVRRPLDCRNVICLCPFLKVSLLIVCL